MKRRILFIIPLLCLAFFARSSRLESKTPSWQVGEHPRLMATAAEKAGLIAKVNTAGSVSKALWDRFLVRNDSNYTIYYGQGVIFNYADGAVIYWLTNDATNGQRAHTAVMNLVAAGDYAVADLSKGYEMKFWNYRDMLLNYDFAYDLFTPTERQQVLNYILRQGAMCHGAGANWAPGNINALWALCEYASAVMLENENVSLTIIDEPVVRGAGTRDLLSIATDADDITIESPTGGAIAYTETTDYTTGRIPSAGSRWINWSPAGVEPAAATTYYVSYTVNPRLEHWRMSSKLFIDYHLNYNWRDGTYIGGFHPYAGAALESVLDMIEIAKRDLNIDYSQNQDLKKYIDAAMYELLPYTPSIWNASLGKYINAYSGSDLVYRYDSLSDSDPWLDPQIDWPDLYPSYKGWTRRMITWGMAQYGNDPNGYGQKYLWYWDQMFRNADGTLRYSTAYVPTDWREAFWFNDALAGSYPVRNVPTPNWPTYKFFRGRDLVIARSEPFGSTNPDAAYFSLLAQNHNHQAEHDQGDSGSFTFYSHKEDWAIDPGYQRDNGSGGYSYDHNTVGIDGAGVNATGAYGVANTTPRYGGFSHIDEAALTDGASVMKADLTRAWSLTDTPFVDHQWRYTAMINGGPSSYIVVGDDIQKDDSAHTYQWYFSTGPGNTMTRTGSVATITGVRSGATLKIHTIQPASTSENVQDWSAGNIVSATSSYKRLTIQSGSTVNPYFLNLLIPTPAGSAAPLVEQAAVTNGVKATVTWSNGMVDTILWRTAAGTITDGTLSSDAKLAIIRDTNGVLSGLSLIDGRILTRNGQDIFIAQDGTLPVTVSAFGSDVSATGADTSSIRLALSGIESAHASDGRQELLVSTDGTMTYIVGGISFDAVEQNQGQLLTEDFSSGYMPDLYYTNLDRYTLPDQWIQNGVLDLRATTWDWISRSKRDSTQWSRAGNSPSTNPPDMFQNADYSWRFRYTDAADAARKFRTYLLVHDRNSAPWVTNQDYLRIESSPATGTVTIGQRVNGAWSDIPSNDVLTSTTATLSIPHDDSAWHTIRVRIDGSTLTLWFDGVEKFSGPAIGAMPAFPGYWQWNAVGTSHVQIDDLAVAAIDRSVPAAPSGGVLGAKPDGTGQVSLTYNRGQSADATTLTMYESQNPIQASDAVAGLTVIGTTASSTTTLTVGSINPAYYHAAAVQDAAGNRSLLLPLTVDVTPPAQVTDLRAQ